MHANLVLWDKPAIPNIPDNMNHATKEQHLKTFSMQGGQAFALIQTEISQQLRNGWPQEFDATFLVPRRLQTFCDALTFSKGKQWHVVLFKLLTEDFKVKIIIISSIANTN